MVAGFVGIVARGKELAQRRRQQLSTAHVLCALLQDDAQVAQTCAALGLSEMHLLAALGQAHEERHNAVDLAIERARKLAAMQGMAQCSLHLLLAITRDPRSAGSLGLVRVGLAPDAVAQQALRDLGADPRTAQTAETVVTSVQAHDASDAAAHRPAHARPARMPRARSRRERERGLSSSLLAQQTELKLQRPSARDPLYLPSAAPENAPKQARKAIITERAPASVPPSVAPSQRNSMVVPAGLDAQMFPLLSAIGRNLTLLASRDQIDPVIGRDAEIDMLLDVLARRRGNNPVLVGLPGVGKTAIVEGLARALSARGGSGLGERVLIEISASSLLAGTGVRGALSERVQALRAEVQKSAGKVLLFIDEIHTLIGGAEGDSLGNELKTALARGELPVIGATTDVEYRRIFERDAALARRFTRIEVAEPSPKDALSILQGLAGRYEAHHGVRYEPRALEAAVELSVRFLCERQLPDKAIALIDQAGARVHRRAERTVDVTAVAQVVSELAGVPLERLLMRDGEALLSLDTHLAERVVGQASAVSVIANAMRRSAAGFRGKRPLGTLLFLGPTGVGKTEMAKAIAERLFPSTPITRIDMSELGEPHAVARLFGAPPGYIGHDEGGQLTEAVRHRPYQLVLLDEIEKAHVDVLLALLPLLDEGRLTDGRGRTVDFTNTVIVMTSNLGAQSALSRTRIGFGETASSDGNGDETAALSAARAALPPELWNRIDEPLFFHPLCERDVAQIAQRLLREVTHIALSRHGVTLDIDDSAVSVLIAAGGFDRALGARPMRRTISRLVEAPLAHALLAHDIGEGDRVLLRASGKQLEFVRNDEAIPAVG